MRSGHCRSPTASGRTPRTHHLPPDTSAPAPAAPAGCACRNAAGAAAGVAAAAAASPSGSTLAPDLAPVAGVPSGVKLALVGFAGAAGATVGVLISGALLVCTASVLAFVVAGIAPLPAVAACVAWNELACTRERPITRHVPGVTQCRTTRAVCLNPHQLSYRQLPGCVQCALATGWHGGWAVQFGPACLEAYASGTHHMPWVLQANPI